jgi:Saxitoxin biosynthesis operon protein SxtJ
MSQVFHEDFSRKTEVKGSSNRSFGLVFSAFFCIIGLLPVLHDGTVRLWALVLAAIFLLASFACPDYLAPLNRLWARLGALLHKVANPVVLGLMFFVALAPIAIARRLLGKDSLKRRFDPVAGSYWIARKDAGPVPESMRNLY